MQTNAKVPVPKTSRAKLLSMGNQRECRTANADSAGLPNTLPSSEYSRSNSSRTEVSPCRFRLLHHTDLNGFTIGQYVRIERRRTSSSDAKRKGIRYGGYLVSFRNGHAQVRMDDDTYRELKAYYADLACRRKAEQLITEFYNAPFEPYSPVKRQMFNILREVNRKRKTAGFSQIPSSAIWLKRKIVTPFSSEIAGSEPKVQRPTPNSENTSVL